MNIMGLEYEDILHHTSHKIIIQNRQKDKDLKKSYRITKIILYRIFIGPIRNILLSKKIAKL